MKPRKDLSAYWRDLCTEIKEDDGLTPTEQKKQHDRRTAHDHAADQDRANRRLCAQAQRALRLALLGDCHDADLQSLEVTRVEPWPDARRLRVHLSQRNDCGTPCAVLTTKVHAVSHLLRHAVAQAVTRKRAPQLVFVVEPNPHNKDGGDEA